MPDVEWGESNGITMQISGDINGPRLIAFGLKIGL
jgi:hypothetical protein